MNTRFLVCVVLAVTTAAAPRAVSQCEFQKLAAFDPASYAEFGTSADMDGGILAIGAARADPTSGAVYVYRWQSTEWIFEQKLVPRGATQPDHFGVSVDVDGDRILVGAHLTPVGSQHAAGAAYLYQFDGTRWRDEQTLQASDGAAGDNFGIDVALDGERAVIGAGRATVSGEINAGACYAFQFQRLGTVWVETQKILPENNEEFRFFGEQIALSGADLVVSADGDDDIAFDAGAAYVFTDGAGSWVMTDKLKASDAAFKDGFGRSVAIEGDRLVVGARRYSAPGAAYVFDRSGNTWTETNILEPGEVHESVASDLEMRGDWIAVGNLSGASKLYLYYDDGTGPQLRSEITSSDHQLFDSFSDAIAMGSDQIVVCAPNAENGSIQSAGAAYGFYYSSHEASWLNYGSGWPGTLGVPNLTVTTDPVLGSPITAVMDNSLGADTFSLLLLGLTAADIQTNKGGRILVDAFLSWPLLVPASGLSLTTMLECRPELAGLSVFAQGLQSDPGASHGLSFTPGLELRLGY